MFLANKSDNTLLFLEEKRYIQYTLEISSIISIGYEMIKRDVVEYFKSFFCTIYKDGEWKFNDDDFQKFFKKNGKKLGIFEGAKIQMLDMEWLINDDILKIDNIINVRNYCVHDLHEEIIYEHILDPKILDTIAEILYNIKYFWMYHIESSLLAMDRPEQDVDWHSFAKSNSKNFLIDSMAKDFMERYSDFLKSYAV